MAPALRRCLYCGGAPVEAERPRERHLECPDCKGTMSEAEEGSVLVDRCGACGGAWYDRGELEQAIDAEKAKAQSLWDGLPGGSAPDGKVAYRSCPICRQTMLRKRRGPAIIDVCGPHGAFLDAGELEQIAQHQEPPKEEPAPKASMPRPAYTPEADSFAEAATGVVAVELAAELIAGVFFDW